MKKKIIGLLTLIMLFTPTSYAYGKDINERVMQGFILGVLSNYMFEAVDKYYGEPRMFDLYDAKIIEMKPLKDGERFSSEIKVQIQTYVGPHNPPYGIDTITFIQDFGDIKVTKFEHKDFKTNK